MSWIAVGTTVAGVAMKGVDMYNAYSDKKEAQGQLDELGKHPLSQYTASPELLSYYQKNLSMSNNPEGFSAGEKSAYRGNVATNIFTQDRNANLASGGQFSKYINNALTPAAVAGENTFAAQDATLKRNQENSAMGRLGGAVTALQSLKDKNVAQENQRQLMTQQALGQSILQNKAFMTQSMEGMGSDLMGAGLMLGVGGMQPGTFKNLFGKKGGAGGGVGNIDMATGADITGAGGSNPYMWGDFGGGE